MELVLTDKQLEKIMGDPSLRSSVVDQLAQKSHNAIAELLGEHVGRKFPFPVAFAERISGFSEKWIRANIPLIKAEGQRDNVEFGDLIDAMNDRKVKA
ncbi:hypothetical protein OAI07_01190 [Akkermansiaceae bacterium]|nr:hypothetical protein [Akkermansiaceae bacterium]